MGDKKPNRLFSYIVGAGATVSGSLSSALGRLMGADVSFSQILMGLIDAKGMRDVEVYQRANIDRRLFSKIRKRGYRPSKPTVLALAIAMELTIDETVHLLTQAGYSLSPILAFDVIVAHEIRKGRYDVHGINEVLFRYDQPLLGG